MWRKEGKPYENEKIKEKVKTPGRSFKAVWNRLFRSRGRKRKERKINSTSVRTRASC